MSSEIGTKLLQERLAEMETSNGGFARRALAEIFLASVREGAETHGFQPFQDERFDFVVFIDG